MYHRFSPDGQDHPRRLSERAFRRQLDLLHPHYRVWTPDQQLENMVEGQRGPNRPPVVLTVDDGYADFHTVAFPHLARRGLSAMVFVVTGFVAGRSWLWWDRLRWLVDAAPPEPTVLNFLGTSWQGDLSQPRSRDTLWETAADALAVSEDKDKEQALVGLATQLGLDIPRQAPADYAAFGWDDLREMANAGISFGAHTVNHPVLSRIDLPSADKEIRDSRSELAAEWGRPVRWFCYPQGGPDDYTVENVEQVRAAGFAGCYIARPIPSSTTDPMVLPRYSAPADQTEFLWIMCGAARLAQRLAPPQRRNVSHG